MKFVNQNPVNQIKVMSDYDSFSWFFFNLYYFIYNLIIFILFIFIYKLYLFIYYYLSITTDVVEDLSTVDNDRKNMLSNDIEKIDSDSLRQDNKQAHQSESVQRDLDILHKIVSGDREGTV